VNLVRLGHQQSDHSSDLDVDAAIVYRIQCGDRHGVVINQNCFEANCATRRPVPVWSQASATATTTRSRLLRNDQIDRDDNLFAVDFSGCDPSRQTEKPVGIVTARERARLAKATLDAERATREKRIEDAATQFTSRPTSVMAPWRKSVKLNL